MSEISNDMETIMNWITPSGIVNFNRQGTIIEININRQGFIKISVM